MNLNACDRLATLPVPPSVLVLLWITSINSPQRESVKETKTNVDKCCLVIWNHSYCLALLNLAVQITSPVRTVTEMQVHRHLLTYPEQTWLLPITYTKKLQR